MISRCLAEAIQKNLNAQEKDEEKCRRRFRVTIKNSIQPCEIRVAIRYIRKDNHYVIGLKSPQYMDRS